MDKNQQAKELISKYHLGLASLEERLLVEQWFLIDLEQNVAVPGQEAFERADARISAGLNAHLDELGVATRGRFKLWQRIIVAAAALVAIVFGVWVYTNEVDSLRRTSRNEVVYKDDMNPGRNTATLTLANGKIINLSDAKTGIVIGDDLRYNDGTSILSSRANVKDPDPSELGMTSIITTPRGGTYQVILSDGSRVWLNAASSIKFPKSFAGMKERSVELTGEAYFEIFKNKDQKFVLTTKNQQVEVLGTHFNISAYQDESSTKTTLLEGAVAIRYGDLPEDGAVLSPNQQAILTANKSIKVKEVNPNEAIAWKNGLFQFDRADIKTVMRQIARWYDVEIVYEGALPERELTGEISRNVKASQALELLKNANVHFRIEGKKIIVTNE